MFLFYEINTIQTSDPVINCENDEDLILIDTKTLKDSQLSNNNSCLKTFFLNIFKKILVNETEMSYFKMNDYKQYKRNNKVHIVNQL